MPGEVSAHFSACVPVVHKRQGAGKGVATSGTRIRLPQLGGRMSYTSKSSDACSAPKQGAYQQGIPYGPLVRSWCWW